MIIKDLTPGDDFKVVSTQVQYEYEGYLNHHRTGFIHWCIDASGIKKALSYKTEVVKV